MDELKANLKAACKKLFGVDIEPELTRPEEKFGDYATNLALQLGKQLGKNPRQVAEQLAQHVRGETSHMLEVNVAGEGFINFTLTDEVLSRAVTSATKLSKPLDGQEILVEFGDPNPFKEMHIGHLYSYIVGDSISKLLETSGATVRRLSYHGDVGLHVARAIFGLRELEKESKDRNKSLSDIPVIERENFLDSSRSVKSGSLSSITRYNISRQIYSIFNIFYFITKVLRIFSIILENIIVVKRVNLREVCPRFLLSVGG